MVNLHGLNGPVLQRAAQQAPQRARPHPPPHLRRDEVDVDQVLDGPRAAHADAQLLPQAAARAVGSRQVPPRHAVDQAPATAAIWC